MLSLAALAAVAGPHSSRQEGAGLDPGIFSLVGWLASVARRSRVDGLEAGAADLVSRSGGSFTDEVERRIAAGFTAGRF